MQSIVMAFAIAGGLLIGALIIVEIGQRVGRRRKRDSAATSQLGTLQGAVLGLLALLLGFSFSGASGRFAERQDLIVREANAIGTAYLRADLLEPALGADLRAQLKAYTESRMRFFNAVSIAETNEAARQSALLHTSIWDIARRGVVESPHFAVAILNPINDIFDLHSVRMATMHRHLPVLVLSSLLVSAGAALFMVGYGDGITGQRNRAMSTALALLIAIVLWVTIDLDYPRYGLIRINQYAMEQLLRDIGGGRKTVSAE